MDEMEGRGAVDANSLAATIPRDVVPKDPW